MHGCGVKIWKRPDGSIGSQEGKFFADEFVGPIMPCGKDDAFEAAVEADMASYQARSFQVGGGEGGKRGRGEGALAVFVGCLGWGMGPCIMPCSKMMLFKTAPCTCAPYPPPLCTCARHPPPAPGPPAARWPAVKQSHPFPRLPTAASSCARPTLLLHAMSHL